MSDIPDTQVNRDTRRIETGPEKARFTLDEGAARGYALELTRKADELAAFNQAHPRTRRAGRTHLHLVDKS